MNSKPYVRHVVGRSGEDIAYEYLLKNKYKIIERNFLCRTGEIDIIAYKDKHIIFVEVKTRTNRNYGLPAESVTKGKLERMYKTARYYLHINKAENEYVRFDVIEVYYSKNNGYKLNHIKQVI